MRGMTARRCARVRGHRALSVNRQIETPIFSTVVLRAVPVSVVQPTSADSFEILFRVLISYYPYAKG